MPDVPNCNSTGSLFALGLAAPAPIRGQYPDHPVKVIVTLSAGGSVDVIALTISQKTLPQNPAADLTLVSRLVNQPVVLVNCGVTDITLSAWLGLLARAKSPAGSLTCSTVPSTALDANINAKLAENSAEAVASSPEELQRKIAQSSKWHPELFKAADLTQQ